MGFGWRLVYLINQGVTEKGGGWGLGEGWCTISTRVLPRKAAVYATLVSNKMLLKPVSVLTKVVAVHYHSMLESQLKGLERKG